MIIEAKGIWINNGVLEIERVGGDSLFFPASFISYIERGIKLGTRVYLSNGAEAHQCGYNSYIVDYWEKFLMGQSSEQSNLIEVIKDLIGDVRDFLEEK